MRIAIHANRSLTRRDQISFFKRLSLLLASGIPLGDSLCIIKNQTAGLRHAKSFEHVYMAVMQGQSFSTALQATCAGIEPLTICMIRIGETHGILEENISRIILELKKQEDMRQRIISACVYPCVIMAVTAFVTLGIVVYLFPKVLPILESLHGDVPFLTHALLFLFHNWLAFTILLGACLCVVIVLLRINSIKKILSKTLVALPLFGALIQEYNISLLARSMGLLLSTGTPLLLAIRESMSVVRNPHYRAMMESMEQSIIAGGRMSGHLENFTHLIPVNTATMIATGEKTGQLASSLLYVASASEESLDESMRILGSMIEPLMMVVIGIVVGAVALAIITPLYGITQSLYLH